VNDRERTRRFATERKQRLRAGIRIQQDTAAEVKRLLDTATKRIAEVLAAAPSDYKLWQLTELQRSIARATADLQPGMSRAFDGSMDVAWRAGQALIDAPFAAAGVDLTAQLVAIDNRKLLSMRAFVTDRIQDITTSLVNRINAELGQAAIGTQTPFETAERIAGMMQSGGMRRATTIVRTELGRAFSVAAQQRQVQAAEILPGLKKQWRRSGKVHSRYEHDVIDGQIRDVDKPFDLPNGVKLMHPRDPSGPIGETINCGCASIPYIESWKVRRPGRQAFTEEEMAKSRLKRLLADA